METTNEFVRRLGVDVSRTGSLRWPERVKARIVGETMGLELSAVKLKPQCRPDNCSYPQVSGGIAIRAPSPYDGRPRWRVGSTVEITSEARDRPTQIVEPAHAFLFFNRHPRRIYFALQGSRAFQFVTRPKLCGGQTKWQPLWRDRQAHMHEHPANQILLAPLTSVARACGRAGKTDLLRVCALECKIRCVLKNKDWSVGRLYASGAVERK